MLILVRPIPGITAGTTGACSRVWERSPGASGSIIFDHEGAACTDRKYHQPCRGLHRGEPDGWPAPRGRPGDRVGAGRRPRRQDTGRVITTATGTPLGAKRIQRMFQDVCDSAGLGRDWAPGDLRHTFVLSDDGMAIEMIAWLVGHASSHVTETMYRQELRPVLQEGAEVMDRLFS